MLSRIIQWSGKNALLVLLATLFVILGGVVAVMKTPLDALPDLSDVPTTTRRADSAMLGGRGEPMK